MINDLHFSKLHPQQIRVFLQRNPSFLLYSFFLKDDLEKLVYVSMLCNDTKVGKDNELTGDPTETALVDMGFALEFKPELFEMLPRVTEIPFDSDRKLMTTIHKLNDKYIVYTKGGVDELLKRCNKYILNNELKDNLVPINNIKELSSKILEVINNYKKFDNLNYEKFIQKFEARKIANKYINLVNLFKKNN